MRKYYRNIILSKTPLKSQFRYNDIFQILPINDSNIPISPYNNHFPLFLEFYIDHDTKTKPKKTDILDELATQETVKTEIINVLSVLSNHRFFNYRVENHQWAIMTPSVKFADLNPEQQELYNNQYSSWTISGFLYPGLRKDLLIDSFTDFKFPTTQLISPSYKYFTDDPVDSKNKEITLPDSIISSLDNYYNLSSKTKKRIKSAVYMICDGIDIADYRRSLAFLSFVSAIENIVTIEFDDSSIVFECNSCQRIAKSPHSCPNCGQPIWGIKTKFKEFLKKFVAGGASSVDKYNKIYNLRSKIAHAGRLLLGDYDLSLNNSDSKNDDWLMKLETLQLARISITNWLRYPDKASK